MASFIIVLIKTQRIEVTDCQVEAVEHNGCNGKENSEKVQNHVQDDLKKGNSGIFVNLAIETTTLNMIKSINLKSYYNYFFGIWPIRSFFLIK